MNYLSTTAYLNGLQLLDRGRYVSNVNTKLHDITIAKYNSYIRVNMETIHEQLASLHQQGLYRKTRTISSMQRSTVIVDHHHAILLCSNNYLGLAEHPDVIKESIEAVQQYGTSSGASRLVSGTMSLHEELEQAIADFKVTKTALLFNNGYAANTGIIQALVGRGDTVFSDRLNHASIIDGVLLSGARLYRYQHNDVSSLRNLLENHRGTGRVLIVTDGVFSMDGDCARLVELVELKKQFNTFLMVDDAHGCGVLGDGGRGVVELQSVQESVDIQMGTLGKAFGSFGAYCAVSDEMRQFLINKSRSFIFSTSLPPAVLGASLAALRIIRSQEGKGLRDKLLENACYFRDKLVQGGFRLPDGCTQIVPIVTGASDITMEFSKRLLAAGIFVQGIRPPTVPAGSCRLRCTVMATHSREQLDSALSSIISIGCDLGVI